MEDFLSAILIIGLFGASFDLFRRWMARAADEREADD